MKRPALQNEQVVVFRMAFRDFRETGPWAEDQQIQPTSSGESALEPALHLWKANAHTIVSTYRFCNFYYYYYTFLCVIYAVLANNWTIPYMHY